MDRLTDESSSSSMAAGCAIIIAAIALGFALGLLIPELVGW